jgi:hypothetical protein
VKMVHPIYTDCSFAEKFWSVSKFYIMACLLKCKILQIFFLCRQQHAVKLCPQSCCTVAKNLHNCSSYAMQQLHFTGRCKTRRHAKGSGRQQNTVHYCDTFTYFVGVKLRILANHMNPFYIESYPTYKKLF